MIFVAAMLPVFFGGALLAVDAARLFNLQTLLQKGADALAVAGAKELDGRATAIARANAAIAALVDNMHTFGETGVAEIVVSQARFLSGLPADDATPIDGSYVTANPATARLLEITVTPIRLNTIFPAVLLGAPDNTATVTASAVAGFNLVMCQFTPVFMCNPYEGTGISILDVISTPSLQRRLINLKKHGGGGAQYSPGNYGFLQPIDNPGADALRDMIGMSNPPICFLQNGVTLRPGFISTVRDAVNTRFDIYRGPMNSKRNNPDFRPARNVRKGYEGPDCNPLPDEDDPPQNQGLTRDTCFADGDCAPVPAPNPGMGGRMGDGEWDFDQYWATNFGHDAAGNLPPPNDGNGAPYQCSPTACLNPPSRYHIYRSEIGDGLTSTSSLGGEVGAPQCSSSSTSDNPDRRMLFGAILNCLELGITGGASGPYPVEAFVKFFVTEPMVSGPDEDLYVEMVDVFEPGGDGTAIVRDDVQLYR